MCNCPACMALAERYRNDPKLLDFYRKRLLVRGWAGRPDDVERAYILAHAPWAQANVEKLRKAHSHVSNVPPQTVRFGEVVSADVNPACAA